MEMEGEREDIRSGIDTYGDLSKGLKGLREGK
jgi:hypothetical protein